MYFANLHKLCRILTPGYLVVRYHCASSDETQRQRMYEKALDAVATSPYAGSIDGWVLAGLPRHLILPHGVPWHRRCSMLPVLSAEVYVNLCVFVD
jgi:hypothetical protein